MIHGQRSDGVMVEASHSLKPDLAMGSLRKMTANADFRSRHSHTVVFWLNSRICWLFLLNVPTFFVKPFMIRHVWLLVNPLARCGPNTESPWEIFRLRWTSGSPQRGTAEICWGPSMCAG